MCTLSLVLSTVSFQVTYDTGMSKKHAPPQTEEPIEGHATVDDVGKSIHQQLLLLVEWAKTLPPFKALGVHDQVCR